MNHYVSKIKSNPIAYNFDEVKKSIEEALLFKINVVKSFKENQKKVLCFHISNLSRHISR